MRTLLQAALVALVVSGVLLLVLGLALWTGKGFQLVGLHVALGLVLVGSLWTIALIAARAGVPAQTVGLLVLALGFGQRNLLPGSWHWTVQILHLVVSMGAIWWGRHLVREIRALVATRARHRPSSPVPSSGSQ